MNADGIKLRSCCSHVPHILGEQGWTYQKEV